MNYNEADTRAKLIDPAIHRRGWTEDFIRREESAGAIEIIAGKANRHKKGKVDYVLRIKVNQNTQPVAVALIEAKKNTLPPGYGLTQAKGYAECKRLNVPFVFSSNGYQFVEFDRFTDEKTDYDYKISLTTTPCNFGGVRFWFICPLIRNGVYCGSRIGTLYLASGGNYFGCRHCYDLSYESRNESRLGRPGGIETGKMIA